MYYCPFYISLNSVCSYFIKEFCVYVYEDISLLFLFFCNVLARIWCLGYAGLIKPVGKCSLCCSLFFDVLLYTACSWILLCDPTWGSFLLIVKLNLFTHFDTTVTIFVLPSWFLYYCIFLNILPYFLYILLLFIVCSFHLIRLIVFFY